jgi:hypothetical protein
MDLVKPDLPALTADAKLNVEGFANFTVSGTTVERPLFLRKHLIDVHDAAVRALTSEEIDLVSLVGCPGVGKTWCGWLVTYTLEQTFKVPTLHLTIRGNIVTAIVGLSKKKKYSVHQFTIYMLKEVIKDSKCKCCVLDIGEQQQTEVGRIFICVRSLLEAKYCGVKFMGLLSGHGQETIIGKQRIIGTQALVMWSWTEEEVSALKPPEGAFAVCGGSVRYLHAVETDKKLIEDIIVGLSQAELGKLLSLDAPASDEAHKQRTRLMAFRPKYESSDFRDGVRAAALLPRSDFVIKCIRQNERASFSDVASMYRRLSDINSGAAGIAFELLVHIFWRERFHETTKVQLTLIEILDTGADGKEETFSIDCSTFPRALQNIEDFDVKEGDLPLGYFTPTNPRYPVLDSILRFKTDDSAVQALALQVSIGEKHQHGNHDHRLLDSDPRKLALWDFRAGRKVCTWSPPHSEHWKLYRIKCPEFDRKMETVGLCILSK